MMRLVAKLLIVTIGLITAYSAPVMAASANNDKLFSACSQTPNSSICQDRAAQNANPNSNPVNHLVNVAISILALLTGIAAVVIIIVSGFRFVTAGGVTPGQRGGDPNQIKTARSALTSAIIGLIIVALAWTILTFLTNKLIKS